MNVTDGVLCRGCVRKLQKVETTITKLQTLHRSASEKFKRGAVSPLTNEGNMQNNSRMRDGKKKAVLPFNSSGTADDDSVYLSHHLQPLSELPAAECSYSAHISTGQARWDQVILRSPKILGHTLEKPKAIVMSASKANHDNVLSQKSANTRIKNLAKTATKLSEKKSTDMRKRSSELHVENQDRLFMPTPDHTYATNQHFDKEKHSLRFMPGLQKVVNLVHSQIEGTISSPDNNVHIDEADQAAILNTFIESSASVDILAKKVLSVSKLREALLINIARETRATMKSMQNKNLGSISYLMQNNFSRLKTFSWDETVFEMADSMPELFQMCLAVMMPPKNQELDKLKVITSL